MIVLGVQKNHNSSVALFNKEELIYFNQEERLSKIKKYSGFPFLCIDEIKKLNIEIDAIVFTGYDTIDVPFIFSYLNYIKLINKNEKIFSFFKSHHLIHAVKSFFNSKFKDAIVIVSDERGSSYNLTNGYMGVETTSVFHINENSIKTIYKKIFTHSKIDKDIKVNCNIDYLTTDIIPLSIDNNTIFEISNNRDMANFYSNITEHCGFEEGEEGKLMGLSAYGKYNENIEKIINSNDFLIDNTGKLNIFKYSKLKDKEIFKDLSYMTQRKFEKDYLKLVKKNIESNFSKNLILTGGTALNVVNNYKIKNNFKNINLFVEPLCGDEGNSIGAAQLYLRYFNNINEFKPFVNLYIGNKYSYNFKLKSNEISFKNVDIKYVTNLLLNGNIIALYQGKAEAGPRALGNRSLLLDPRINNGKDIMNDVKKREFFRPFACSILKEKINEWFDMAGLEESPFMMYAVNALNGVKEKINSVIHEDNTCRVQTVSKKDNVVLYNILKEFDKNTKVPILMHTSFNLSKKPLVETPEDAIDTLRNSKLEYLYFSDINELIYIKNN